MGNDEVFRGQQVNGFGGRVKACSVVVLENTGWGRG